MKKIALLLTFILIGMTQAVAQNFGFKGGYNYSSLNGEVANDSSLKGRSGFYVGALLELPLGDVISLQPELVYSRQGASLGVQNSWHHYNQRSQDGLPKYPCDG